MNSPLLQLTLTIDEAQIGRLLIAALALNARIDALGIIEAVPYTKNVSAQLKKVPAQLKKLEQISHKNGESHEDHLARKQQAREAFTAAVAAAGSEGLDRETARKVYSEAGGDLRGFGGVARNYAIEKRKRLFPKPTEAR